MQMGRGVTKIEYKQKQMKAAVFHMNNRNTLRGWGGVIQVTLEHIILSTYPKPREGV